MTTSKVSRIKSKLISSPKLTDKIIPLKLSKGKMNTVLRTLEKLPENVRRDWLNKLKIKGGKLQGTYYAGIGAVLPYNDFVALYQAIGYDFSTLDAWQDYICGPNGCQWNPGFSCDPNSCGY
jgi:hypothetical protein